LFGGFFSVRPSYSQGLSLFGSENDKNKSSFEPQAHFSKGTINLSYSYPLTNNLYFSSAYFGQISSAPLYTSQRISIGGEYSVRGFKDISISGDEGYYWRNELTYTTSPLPYSLGPVNIVFALDTGAIRPDPNDNYEQGHLTGTALGLRTQQRYMNSSLFISTALYTPSRFVDADSVVVYWNTTFSF